MLECVIACIPYSRKFSRGPIFAVFTVNWQTTKLNPRNKNLYTVRKFSRLRTRD